MDRPNLFAYATSELSQDAVLCWMAGLASHQDADLQRVGRSFLAWLWHVATKDDVAADRVHFISAPKRQVDHIDILIEAAVDDAKVLFLIEDKTDTSQHSGQLERYGAQQSISPPPTSPTLSLQCTRRDLNPHTLRYRNLNPARLPVPPLVRRAGRP